MTDCSLDVAGQANEEGAEIFPEGFSQPSSHPSAITLFAISKSKWNYTALNLYNLICHIYVNFLLREMGDHWPFDMFREGFLINSRKQKDNFSLTNFMGIRDPKCGAASTVC